jgi:L-lactate dehydrogenase (cytochrome)
VLGQRHRDIKNGMTVPPEIRLGNLIDIATKPAWAWSVLRSKRKTFGNIAGHVRGMENVTVLAKWTAEQFDPTLSWKDVEWIKSLWPGKLILKGILDVEDARIAAKTGAAAIVVSNHGSTARPPRSPCCRRSSTRSARTLRSCSTAASARGRI